MSSRLWQSLSELAVQIGECASEEEAFRAAGDGLKSLGLRATIALLDEALERFRVVYASAARPIVVAAERLFGAKGIGYEIAVADSFTLGRSVRERAAVYVRDFLPQPAQPQSRARTFRRGIELLDAAPHIAAPLVARHRVLGALAVQAASLEETDRHAVMMFARQLALAVDNLQRRAEAASRERQLSIIVQINQNVSADLTNVVRAYDVVLREIRRLVSFDRAELALLDADSATVRLSTPGTTLPGEAAGESSYPLHGSIVEWMLAHPDPYLAKDTHSARQVLECREAAAKRLRSLIAMPMRHRGLLLGAFILKSRTPFFYAESDFALLAPIVDQMANTLVNYRLFDQVERGRRQLQAVLDSTGDAVIATDMTGRIVLINPAARSLFRVREKSPHGVPVWDAISLSPLADAFRQVTSGKSDAPLGLELPRGADRVLFADLAPIKDTRSNVLGWMAVVRDITHFKQMEALRSETVATAAHDLKSPLHLTAGALGVLAEEADTLSEDQQEALGIAQSGLRRMRRLIDDILDLKKIEDGFGVVKSDCQLGEVLRSVVDEAWPLAQERGQSLTLDVARDLPVIQADADRLHQVFANLVGNAIKYTQEGGSISVQAQRTGDGLEVSVIDDGPGLSVEDQARIFEKFYRTRSASLVDGTGMGLAIVKTIAEQHGGAVMVKSGLGQGSRFIVSLPIAAR